MDVHDFIEYLRPPGIVKVSLEEQFDPSNVFSIHQGRLKRNGRKVLVKQVVYDDKYSGQEVGESIESWSNEDRYCIFEK